MKWDGLHRNSVIYHGGMIFSSACMCRNNCEKLFCLRRGAISFYTL
jgi:hypothetical protein